MLSGTEHCDPCFEQAKTKETCILSNDVFFFFFSGCLHSSWLKSFWSFMTENIRWNIKEQSTRIPLSNEGCEGCCRRVNLVSCDRTLCWKTYTSTRLYYALFRHSSWHNVASLGVALFCTIAITQMNLHISHSVYHGVYIIGNTTLFAVLLFCTVVPRSTCATSVAAPSNATNATNPVLLSGTHIRFWLFLRFVLLYLVYNMRSIAHLID